MTGSRGKRKGVTCNTRNLHRLIRGTVSRKPGVSEVNKEFDGLLIFTIGSVTCGVEQKIL